MSCRDVQAKAFALLSEEGIAKGVRRIVAVTAADAAAAIAEGDKLAAEVEKAAALPDTELEQVGGVRGGWVMGGG
jgi:alanyl-tRNA synthetase